MSEESWLLAFAIVVCVAIAFIAVYGMILNARFRDSRKKTPPPRHKVVDLYTYRKRSVRKDED